ncbi:MAG: hypothetical protein EOO74_05870 [Myxococcales bacterium]|nr:MAG: hypothetical protein EOO74_05870 [Myxococcales bacterium]
MNALPAGPGLLLVRALVLAGVITATGSVAHTSAGGLLPGAGWLGYLFVTTLAVAALALREEAPTWRLVALMCGGQALVHLFLSATAGHRHIPGQPDHHNLLDLTAHGPMMLAHLAAAAVVGLWLAAGERAVWDLIAVALGVLLRLPAAILPPRRRPVVPAAAVVRRPLAAPLLVGAPRRGPPALLGA